MENRPSYTLVYNIVNASKWVGTGWEFFDTEEDAEARYEELNKQGHCCTLRPYHNTDSIHLGAAHRM